jgi:hypothetical protein
VGLTVICNINKGEELISIRETYGTHVLLVASKLLRVDTEGITPTPVRSEDHATRITAACLEPQLCQTWLSARPVPTHCLLSATCSMASLAISQIKAHRAN